MPPSAPPPEAPRARPRPARHSARSRCSVSPRPRRHEHGRGRARQEIDGGVVAALAHRQGRAGEQGAVIGAGPLDRAVRQSWPMAARSASGTPCPARIRQPSPGWSRAASAAARSSRAPPARTRPRPARRFAPSPERPPCPRRHSRCSGAFARSGVQRPGGVQRHQGRVAVDEHGIVELRHPRMRLRDPLRLGGRDQDVAHGGQDQRRGSRACAASTRARNSAASARRPNGNSW